MPIKKFTPLFLIILLFTGIKFTNAQETDLIQSLNLKNVSNNISAAGNPDKIKHK